MNLSLSPSKPLACVVVILAFTIPSSVFSVYERHRRCSTPFQCGDQVNLSYPFWIPGREGCGPPEFKLNCGRDFAEINISSVNFTILDVSYEKYTLRLVRTDYFHNLCPQNPADTTLNKALFRFTSDTELVTLYYECDDDIPSPPPTAPVGVFNCEDRKHYYVTRNLSSPQLARWEATLNEFKGFCKRNITVPAYESALSTLETGLSPDKLGKALDQGFGLQWLTDVPKCSDCMESKGVCGYEQDSKEFVCYCTDKPHKHTCKSGINWFPKILIGVGGSVVGLVILTFIFLFKFRGSTLLCGRRRAMNDLSVQNLEALIPLKRYSYVEIKKITKSFTHIVGRGGFGTVYKGKLPDGFSVAVKILKESKSNGEEFINEVASMSKTSHVNIVSLLGFCYEGSKRAIVYEFVENGSLDQFILNKNLLSIGWRTLYEIALGVARGLEYLHYGCKTKIVHFDIKPQNILLDDNLCPKVSDFGLAKLCDKKESIMSLLHVRGTFGYIAPEVFSRNHGKASHKSDVYSYGMLVLEMIGARNNKIAENSASDYSSMYFPDWIYKDLERGENTRLLEDKVTEHGEIQRKMVLVGLWCIQTNPFDRPTMSKVIEMMEGNTEALQVPPKPVLFSDTTTVLEYVKESSTSSEPSQRE